MSSGQLYIVSAPSGAGKTSLLKALSERLSELVISVSTTTRVAREGEQEGVNYYFVDKTAFQHSVEADDFVEYAEVFGNFYGTSRSKLEEQLNHSEDVVLEIDWQGARKVRKHFPDVISIFILPPSTTALQDRLSHRKQDSAEIIAGRMDQARTEMSHYDEYQYLIVNDDFDQALTELQAIFTCQKLATIRQQSSQMALFEDLLG
ncbi:MAG: guanylate kinase [Thiotrichaceae bacterium]|nr:guanylate kinase [Thiotrichaceae bacterium]